MTKFKMTKSNLMPRLKSKTALAAGLSLLLVAGALLYARRADASTLSTDIIGMFPKVVGEFAYADLKTARQHAWFNQLRDQLLPNNFRQFEQFLAAAGIDMNTQVDEMAWATIPPNKDHGDQILGVALGSFQPSTIEDRFKQKKVPSIEIHGYHLYAYGSGSGANDILFFFLDSNTAAFGQRAALEKMIDVRFGGSESLLTNDKMFSLIRDANGNGTIWAVLDHNYTHGALEQLLPEAGQFPQAAQILGKLQGLEIHVQASSGIDAQFQAVCDTVDNANLLATALQAGVMYRRYQEAQTHPEIAKALEGVSIVPSGDRIKVDLPVSEDQLQALIKSHALLVQM
jgi:hypothetical protein